VPRLDGVRRWLWLNSLALVCFGAFLVFLVAQSVTGWLTCNDERTELGLVQLGYLAYLGTGHFVEATMENWSPVPPDGSYVLLTAVLAQKGSPEANRRIARAMTIRPIPSRSGRLTRTGASRWRVAGDIPAQPVDRVDRDVCAELLAAPARGQPRRRGTAGTR
jgi:hypothetical protein